MSPEDAPRIVNRRTFLTLTGGTLATVVAGAALPAWADTTTPEMDYIKAQAQANGWWTGNRYIHYFAAPDRTTALSDLRTGSVTFAEEGGTVTQTPALGVTSAGGRLALPSNLAALGIDPDDFVICVVCATNEGETAAQIGTFDSGHYWQLKAWDGLRADAWPGTSTGLPFPGTQAFGVTMTVRSSATAGFHNKDGVITSWNANAVPLPAGPLRVLSTGLSTLTSENTVLAVVFGSPGVTQAQSQNIVDTFTQVLSDLGIDGPPPDDPGPNYFTRAMVDQINPPGLQALIFSGVLAPNDSTTESTYDYFPYNGIVTRPTGVGKAANNTFQTPWEFMWGDRATGPAPGQQTAWDRQGNDTGGTIKNSQGVACRLQYDTYEKAIAAMLGRAMWSLGYAPVDDPDGPDGQGYLQLLDAAGYDVSPWYDALDDPNLLNNDTVWDGGDLVHRAYGVANVDTFFDTPGYGGGLVAVNKVMLGAGRQVDATMTYRGIVLDTEWADDRGETLCVQALSQLGDIVHGKGKEFIVACHVENSGSAEHDGIAKNTIWQAVPHVDQFVVKATSTPIGGDLTQSLIDQEAVLSGPSGQYPLTADQLVLQIDIGNPAEHMTVAATQEARDWMLDRGVSRLLMVRAGSGQGGDIHNYWNQVIATACGLSF